MASPYLYEIPEPLIMAIVELALLLILISLTTSVIRTLRGR
jgi:hypothetical protein